MPEQVLDTNLETTNSYEVPVDLESDGPEAAQAQAAEESRNIEAKAHLADENPPGEAPPPPDLQGVLDKYKNNPIEMAKAIRGMQQLVSRMANQKGDGKGDQKGGELSPEAEELKQHLDQVPPENLPSPEVVQEMTTRLHGVAGDPARFAALQAWAKNSVPPNQLQAYDKALQSGDIDRAEMYLKAFRHDFMNATAGFSGQMVGGRPAQSKPGVQGYTSVEDMHNDMADPRYDPQSSRYSPEFHRTVHERAAAMLGMG